MIQIAMRQADDTGKVESDRRVSTVEAGEP
jgi:hypothetical protein